MDSSRQRWVIEALERYEAPLLRYARRLVRDEETAKDVVQHAFLRLCEQSPDSIRQGVSAWLYAVCRNRVIDMHRKDRRMETLSESEQLSYRSPDPDPGDKCEASDTCDQLRRVVATLNSAQQEVVDLWSEGFNYREISNITDRNENTVRVQVHRALKQIREHPLVRQLLADAPSVAVES
ncbi:MAG: RNA polymerase sigma factor [Pirellulales bacterium]